jgi:hypothetical protein
VGGTPQARSPSLLHPAAIRAVLAANADADTLRRYDNDLDAAFEEASDHGDDPSDDLVLVVQIQWARRMNSSSSASAGNYGFKR